MVQFPRKFSDVRVETFHERYSVQQRSSFMVTLQILLFSSSLSRNITCIYALYDLWVLYNRAEFVLGETMG